MKTLILSDLHLGHTASRAPGHLAGLARAAQAFDRVIVNGDAVNLLECDADRPGADAHLKQLTEALTGRQGPPVLLTGNHDPAVSDIHYQYLDEPGLLVFHGDFVLDRPAPWVVKGAEFSHALYRRLDAEPAAPGFARRAELFRALQREMTLEREELFECRSGVSYVLRQFVPPTRLLTIAHYVLTSPGKAARLAESFAQPVRRVAFGHIHRGGQWRRHGLEVYNTGSFMPFSRAFVLEVEGAAVRLIPVAELLGRHGARVAPGAAGVRVPLNARAGNGL